MRIAYITPYQGPTLLERRPIVRNRSMSNRIKIELIASLLRSKAHEVEVFSHGEVVDHALKFYPSFTEPKRFDPQIPVHYASALPVRRINGFWSSASALRLFKQRHRAQPFDLVVVFNMKGPQIACAKYAMNGGIPVVLEYEDDMFVNVRGQKVEDFSSRRSSRAVGNLLPRMSACIGVSPYLLSQLPAGIPQLLLRGVVGADIVQASEGKRGRKDKVVMFSGTHTFSNGIAELIQGWQQAAIPGWKLYITGYGGLTDSLREMAKNVPGIEFHGLVSREKLVELMASASLCVNPHAVSQTPGNVFAFKIIEYLAAGAHVLTTPMGTLEPDVERGITYMPDNDPKTVAAFLKQAIENRTWERDARQYVVATYGEAATARSLNTLLGKVIPSAVDAEPALAQV